MMKTKVAMAISLAGVLAAGTAAALVNTQVLNGGSSSAFSSGALETQETTPVDSAAPSISAPAATVPAAGVATSPAQATYAIGDSGTVTLDTTGDVLAIAAITPAPGWIVTQSEVDDGSTAEIKFQSGNVEVEFQANLLYGVVRTSVESHDVSSTDSSVSGSTVDDDEQSGDDDDRHGDDDDDDHGEGDDD